MRLLSVLLVIFVVSIVGFEGDDLLRDAKYTANDVTRDVRNWVSSRLP